MDIYASVENLRESWKGDEEEEKNDMLLEEENCGVKTYQDAIKSLKELQQFALQWNYSDMLSVVSQAKVFVESQAAKSVNCVQKPCLTTGRNKEKVSRPTVFFMFCVMFEFVQL